MEYWLPKTVYITAQDKEYHNLMYSVIDVIMVNVTELIVFAAIIAVGA